MRQVRSLSPRRQTVARSAGIRGRAHANDEARTDVRSRVDSGDLRNAQGAQLACHVDTDRFDSGVPLRMQALLQASKQPSKLPSRVRVPASARVPSTMVVHLSRTQVGSGSTPGEGSTPSDALASWTFL